MNQDTGQNNAEQGFKVSRREILTAGGATPVGAALLGSPFSLSASGQNMAKTQDGVMKPVVLPKNGSMDLVDFSIAENAFRIEQMMKHAKFFVMLMPGAESANERSQAARFQQNFAGQFEKSKAARLDWSNYAAFNRPTIELLKPYADRKRKNGDLQAAGKLRSLTRFT
jgi:hypothetical protein